MSTISPVERHARRCDQGLAGKDHTVAAEFARLVLDLHNADDLDETVRRVLRFAQRTVHCDYSGLLLRASGNTFSIGGVSDPRVSAADQLQVDCGEGPWRSRESGQQAIWVFDAAEDPRWPQWGPRVAQLGLRSLLSIQLRTHRSDVGLLNFYSAAPGRFAEAGQASAYLLSRHAAIAIDTAREAATLSRAIESRAVIGKAQGILMERSGLTADQAFAVLQRCSQDTNTKLYEVATSLTETRQLPTR